MDTLQKQLQQLFETNEKWNYYNLHGLPNPFLSTEIDNSKEFVKRFLDYSEKTKNIYNVLELLEPKRFLHIVTVYFLGILIYENNALIKTAIDNQISKICTSDNPNIDNSFKYFWFLMCFYHDVGDYYEKNRSSIQSLSTLVSELKIDFPLQQLLGVPKLFKNVKDNYLKYRLEKFNLYDHGIIGGMLVYDRLKKIYEHYRPSESVDDFRCRGVYWSKAQINYYRLVASAIFAHNIWFKNQDTDADWKKYEMYNLQPLIINDKTKRISLVRHPFLFLLGLVDTMEPTKHYGANFLDKVRIEFSKNNSIILISNNENDELVKKWFDDISKLNKWLVIAVSIETKNAAIKIKL